jgi:hypothetical protein
MSYTALRPGGKEQRAYRRRRYERGGMTEDDVSVYTTKKETGESGRRGEKKDEEREGKEKEKERTRNLPTDWTK